ncbi:putative DNA binding domain-containing protein [Candidatus Berkiella cookevillensis]|uniref:DNA binding domain-containing protein n=1 Tax=Candidatus Berkiella cookevillensis TaxID=437022 RepID=A0A0Q9YQK0_9GAMM|nr:RNA-binding domain-containing protein [Candidatus Berkiella cookevillensis]MCS5707671.1 putative DNA binding domain-containing protein [Candidatus Berkiella cookevillensis]
MKYPGKESATLEFKSTLPGKQQIVSTVIAFCNNFGGRLIIGVDDNRRVVGLPDDSIDELINSLHQSIFQSATPVILPMIYSQRLDDKIILVIEVSSGMNKPYFRTSDGMNNGTFIRVGSHTLKATPEIIQELQWQSRGFYSDEVPVYTSTIDDINLDLFRLFLKQRKNDYNSPDINKMLMQYRLAVEEHKRLYPSVAGILLFGHKPQKFITESFIICSHFKGTSGREALASFDCGGSLFNQLNDCIAFVESRLSRSFKIEGIKREEQLEIPLKALREAIINAIVHRQYQIPGPTKVAIFDDRIEIFSPGNFPGPLQSDELEMGITYLRNSAICRIFREAGYVEKLGSGFLTMFKLYREHQLPTPTVIEGTGYVKCILPRPVLQRPLIQLTEHEEKILELFDVHEEISPQLVNKILCVSRQTTARILSSLVKKGLIRRYGAGKSTRYRKY